MKTPAIFVVLMFLLNTISVIAQDANETQPIEGISAEVTGEPMLISANPETNATPEVTTVQVGKEYSGLDQALDRIRLAFTFQEERKLELMNKIQQRREQHYSFLVANGKTKQAEAFKAKTTGLEKNFEQWKAKRAEKIAKMEKVAAKVKSSNLTEGQKEKVQERLENKTSKIEQNVQSRVQKWENKTIEVDKRLTERENKITKRMQNKSS